MEDTIIYYENGEIYTFYGTYEETCDLYDKTEVGKVDESGRKVIKVCRYAECECMESKGEEK